MPELNGVRLFTNKQNCLKTIGIDLIPMLPGGVNGGAKPFVIDLVTKLISTHPESHFFLFIREDMRYEVEIAIGHRSNFTLITTQQQPNRLRKIARTLFSKFQQSKRISFLLRKHKRVSFLVRLIYRINTLMLPTRHQRMQLKSKLGSYNTETADGNVWNWVEDQIEFNFEAYNKMNEDSFVISFEHLIVGGPRTLSITVRNTCGSPLYQEQIHLKPGWGFYQSKAFPVKVDRVSIEIESDGKPTRISERDQRVASFLIQNFDFRYLDCRTKEIKLDLLFCPFTKPSIKLASDIPTASIVYDLQHAFYPMFFSTFELAHRDMMFDQVKNEIDLCICISNNTRLDLIEKIGVPTDKVLAIPINLQSKPGQSRAPSDKISQEIRKVTKEKYLLYPANFWPHKNHQILLIAFAMALKELDNADFKLILTGELIENSETLLQSAVTLGIGKNVKFLGFVSEQERTLLLENAFAMIYPTLFEGFGMPLIEAMDFSIPVLCSNNSSLPEIGGDAALYFDAKKPQDICDAIVRLSADENLRHDLAVNGFRQAQKYLNHDRMAHAYWRAFETLVDEHHL